MILFFWIHPTSCIFKICWKMARPGRRIKSISKKQPFESCEPFRSDIHHSNHLNRMNFFLVFRTFLFLKSWRSDRKKQIHKRKNIWNDSNNTRSRDHSNLQHFFPIRVATIFLIMLYFHFSHTGNEVKLLWEFKILSPEVIHIYKYKSAHIFV